MKRSDINQPPCYFDKYINLIEDIEIAEAFKNSIDELDKLNLAKYKQIGDRVYAEGKWTIKQILQHLIDAERVLSYRALRISRDDKTILNGFDEELFGKNADVENRSLEDIITELKVVRNSTALLFQSCSEEAVQRYITVSGNQMSALAYGFAILGHQPYHLKIIEERYFPPDK